jgi:hypothetical protein
LSSRLGGIFGLNSERPHYTEWPLSNENKNKSVYIFLGRTGFNTIQVVYASTTDPAKGGMTRKSVIDCRKYYCRTASNNISPCLSVPFCLCGSHSTPDSRLPAPDSPSPCQHFNLSTSQLLLNKFYHLLNDLLQVLCYLLNDLLQGMGMV